VSGQAPTEAEVRELREMLTARYGRDEEWHDEELVALCDAYLAQRDVVDAARAYLAVPRKVEPDADGILRFDFLPQQEARKKLAEAVAAVVSGIPEKP
jgi:hypothetical protein